MTDRAFTVDCMTSWINQIDQTILGMAEAYVEEWFDLPLDELTGKQIDDVVDFIAVFKEMDPKYNYMVAGLEAIVKSWELDNKQ